MTLQDFNQLDVKAAGELLAKCCGSLAWVSHMAEAMPFANEKQLLHESTAIWYDQCSEKDWLEAFTHHPKIGDLKSLQSKFASTSHLAGHEQSSVNTASEDVIHKLAEANKSYEEKFGFIFIVCATGKPAEEMLRLLNDRLTNSRNEELHIAMGEQQKISIIRLKKIFSGADWSHIKPGHITTHVLDTSIGKPGKGITIRLQKPSGSLWQTIAQGVTNADGRIPDLLPQERYLAPGTYKMCFDTGKYFSDMAILGFYPEVEISFTVRDSSHYHVPLLINPFGFSTYRGS